MAHIEHINKTFEELIELSGTTMEPSPMYIQFIGTVVDNTICLLIGPANALDGRNRGMMFGQDRNWVSVIQAMHRSFFVNIHAATEVALNHIAEQKGIKVESSSIKRANKLIQSLAGKINSKNEKDIRSLVSPHCQFNDYLDALISNSKLNTKDKKDWRAYFRALGIIRNKASHGSPTLTGTEKTALIIGGWGYQISADGELVLNTRLYKQVCEHMIKFLHLMAA